MLNNTEKHIHNFSQKSLKYFQKVTNTLDPRSKSSSKSKNNKNKKEKIKVSNLNTVNIKVIDR